MSEWKQKDDLDLTAEDLGAMLEEGEQMAVENETDSDLDDDEPELEPDEAIMKYLPGSDWPMAVVLIVFILGVCGTVVALGYFASSHP